MFAVVSTFAVLATIAGATTVADAFELDGDPQAEAGVTGDDWETLVSGNGTTGNGVEFLAKSIDPDTGTFPIVDGDDVPLDMTYFTGGGSKDELDINATRKNGAIDHNWLYDDGDVAPDKDEILNAFAAAYTVPDSTGASGDADSLRDLVINFGADRLANEGDAAIGFWFFKNLVSLDPDTNQFQGTHANGDILIVTNADGGTDAGDVTEIKVFKWQNGLVPVTTIPGGTVFDCQLAGHNPNLCGTQNHDNGVPAEWAFQAKGTGEAADQYPHHTFYEGGININAIIPGADQCFASFLAETRSATTTTAQLKDFALGEFPVCAPGTDLSASPSVASPEVVVGGDSVTFTFSESNDGNIPLSNVHVDTTNDRCVPGSAVQIPPVLSGGFNIGDLNDDNKLDLNETFQFACTVTTSASTAEVIEVAAVGHGTDPAGRDTTVCPAGTLPANTFCDAEEAATGKAVVIIPGTDLAVSRSPATVKAGENVTFTITETNDGTAPTGFSSFLALSNVSIDSSAGTGATSALANDECDPDLATPTSKTGGDTDNLLEPGETWTYTCTVPAPSDDFQLVFTGSGTVLAGTAHARIVTWSTPCTNSSGTATVTGVFCDSEEQASAGPTVIAPSTRLTVSASALITYTFVEENNSTDAPLTPPGATKASIITTDTSMCDSAITFTGSNLAGTDGTDNTLAPGETWTFTCTKTLAGPTTDTGNASTGDTHGYGHGIDATGDDVTYCAGSTQPADTYCDDEERDGVTVTITNEARGEHASP